MKIIILSLIFLLISIDISCANFNSLQQSAERGDVESQYKLALAYEKGDGVQVDFVKSLKWYHLAAENGYPPAQVDLGWFYQEGKRVPQDSDQAIYWYEKAAKQGNSLAMLNIGWIYDQGIGIKEDNAIAIDWYTQAAEAGHENAQLNLGVMYAFGEEVEKDYIKAYKWLTIVRMYASNKKAKWRARSVLDEIDPKMKITEKEAAKNQVNEWVHRKK